MRGSTLPAFAVSVSLGLAGMAQALAQTPAPAPAAAPAQAAAPAAAGGDPVVAKVGDDEIHASDLAEAARSLPEELRGMPPNMLYPMLVDQLIDRRAVVIAARKRNLQSDPAVEKQIVRATDMVLQNALLTREIAPMLTDDAIKARYQKEYAGKPGEQEAHAAHILVADEGKAREIIAALKAGADFGKLAQENSTDPSAKGNSGDLGFFKKGDMLPEFSDAAFGLKPGEVTQAPVKTRFGFHVIKLIEFRQSPPPELDQVKDEIRQGLIQEGVARVLAEAKTGLAVQKFNQDGTPATDAPAPPQAAPAK